MTEFTLLVVATEDGFIARHPGHGPWDWASAEEQALFLAAVDRADWGVMGRGTHEAALKPHRRRIVFSRSAPEPEWRTPNHLWLDPARLSAAELPGLVAARHPMTQALVLGGTAVHDWFQAQGRLDRVVLTVEPIRFGTGLPIFSDQAPGEGAEAAFIARGYGEISRQTLNAGGTLLIEYRSSQACHSG